MRAWLRSLKATYLTIDPRSLGLFRIGLGLLLLWDLLRRYQQLEFFYTNAGLLPNHTLLWRPPAAHVFSLFFVASSSAEARVGFALCACVYLLFLAGYRTRLTHVLALLCRVSLNSRIAVLENGGDMVINLLCVLTLPLPLGRRFSFDACRPGPQPAVEHKNAPVASLAVLGLLAQFSAIYLFNALAKNGDTWRQGYAVYYALHQDKFVTPLGVWLREHASVPLIQSMTWATLATEWTLFALIITPCCVTLARSLAVVLLPSLHLCFALGLNLGSFSPAMMSFAPLLLTPFHWERAARAIDRRPWLQARSERACASVRRLATAVWAGSAPRPPPSPRRAQVWVREVATALLLFAIASETLNDNTAVPQWLRVRQPAWAKAVVEYPRLLQGWRMFAPNPPLTDAMIYVDATTAEGRHVDPYNEVASRQHYPAASVVPQRMGQTQFFTMYSDRIAAQGYAVYRQAFLEWLLAYPRRTGREADCLLAFDVYYVSDQTPPPGSDPKPIPRERTRFMHYVAPSEGPCRPLRKPRRLGPLQARAAAGSSLSAAL